MRTSTWVILFSCQMYMIKLPGSLLSALSFHTLAPLKNRMLSNRWHENTGVTSLFWCLITFFIDCHLKSWLRFCHTWMTLLFSASVISISSSTSLPTISKYQPSLVNAAYTDYTNEYVYLIQQSIKTVFLQIREYLNGALHK